MIFPNDRDSLRRTYLDAWNKHQDGRLLSPLESQIVAVIELHPEYHGALTTDGVTEDYTVEGGETNPFLHMGLHLGLREQIATDRPPGIATLHRRIVAAVGDAHAAEHQMIDCLAETLWEAQRDSRAPDEQKYLERLRRLAGKTL